MLRIALTCLAFIALLAFFFRLWPSHMNVPTNVAKTKPVDCPNRRYVVMIDAGSTGSRVHVYDFAVCGPSPELVNETFEMLKPGLSSFPGDPKGAAMSLKPLLDVAMAAVPSNRQSSTPISVKATAGLRLLGETKSAEILKGVESYLREYPFILPENAVSIMDGADEGVYAWITTNYLLGNIGINARSQTAAVFDLGGGSTQVVFEPSHPDHIADPKHKYELTFAGKSYVLYQHSHLGYGLMEARKKVFESVYSAAKKNSASAGQLDVIVNPCLPPKVEKSAEIGSANEKVSVSMIGPDVASSAQCRSIAENILKKDAHCPVGPCSFNGIHQPSISDAFPEDSDIYIFSYFYDRTSPLGMPQSFTIAELRDLTSTVCLGKDSWSTFGAIEGAVAELEEGPEWCLDLNFIYAILHTGYDLPLNREVKIAKKIKDNELGWCLGASIPLLSLAS
ncbi:hypothetical protein CANCADRAFT_32630 [Tortispora caseinolytica NRRL Y-17796]|uniref:guanosine-diphosphatase n=1 Tax=Tortispora caseinolytica NRRL Y-17796 TaxID=767744 RepID=A0A1E4TC74_9ASCO|nr:hypothetical protein CANCADRAFT_32630 [Tortispora caseinolytica NRRL Y-17796]